MESHTRAPSSDGGETARPPTELTPRIGAELYLNGVEKIVRNHVHKGETYKSVSGERANAIARIADRALAMRMMIPHHLAILRKYEASLDEAIIKDLGDEEGLKRACLIERHGTPPIDVLTEKLQELAHWLAIDLPDSFAKCRSVARYLDSLATKDKLEVNALLDELARIECLAVTELAKLAENEHGNAQTQLAADSPLVGGWADKLGRLIADLRAKLADAPPNPIPDSIERLAWAFTIAAGRCFLTALEAGDFEKVPDLLAIARSSGEDLRGATDQERDGFAQWLFRILSEKGLSNKRSDVADISAIELKERSRAFKDCEHHARQAERLLERLAPEDDQPIAKNKVEALEPQSIVPPSAAGLLQRAMLNGDIPQCFAVRGRQAFEALTPHGRREIELRNSPELRQQLAEQEAKLSAIQQVLGGGSMSEAAMPAAEPRAAEPQAAAHDNPKNRKAGINARMLETIQRDMTAMGWTSRSWAKHLKCSPSSIVATDAWESLESARLRAKASRMSDRRRKPKASDLNRNR